MIRIFVAALLALPSFAAAAALPGLPKTGRTAADFAPKGWTVEQQVVGELGGDARPDLAVVLVKVADGDAERPRALVWLHGADGGYALVGSNVGLLACVACLGINGGDGAPVVEIQKRVLVVQQEGGSREAYGCTHRLRHEAEGVRLIGLDRHDLDRGTGASSSTSVNFLTGAKVEERTKEGGATKATRSRLPVAALTPLESVTGYGTP